MNMTLNWELHKIYHDISRNHRSSITPQFSSNETFCLKLFQVRCHVYHRLRSTFIKLSLAVPEVLAHHEIKSGMLPAEY